MKNTNSLLSLAFLSLGFFGSNAQAALTNRIALDTTTSYASKAFTQRLGAEVSADNGGNRWWFPLADGRNWLGRREVRL